MALLQRLLLNAVACTTLLSAALAQPLETRIEPLHSADNKAKSCDFLKQWNKSLPELKFTKCRVQAGELVNTGQSEAFTAIYTVKGADAVKVEAFLHQQFGMDRLRFICCYWGSSPKSFRREGYPYTITMASDETVEQQWHRIPTFRVSVLQYLTDP